ncbi:MAG: glutamine--tRNA ligase/YqeY domain fusion protein [Myxococcales bacterium FL481]|nr:MAG: glutamine--tRNA ligase/YqeY domain fusion protein [Myxococcales bacterium FL481]
MSPAPEQPSSSPAGTGDSVDFVRQKVAEDLASNKYNGRVVTRFPPEPNGYLHIGHAKAITIDFSIAAENPGGRCHLRFDDTNPVKEDTEYVEAIKRDVRWLGFDWGEHLYFASDYFERMYELAVGLIEAGKAYVCSLSEDEIREYRGSITEPGRASPYRDRTVEDNLDLFRRMRAGEFEDGAHVLRAKMDMSAPNLKLRDPLLYRIRHVSHHRTGDTWCIYPMYDYAHPLEDAIEGVTHSLCSLEFENNRPIYDWVVRETGFEPPPEQTEFARLNLTYTVMSKRKLLELVQRGDVAGWDDPRMPTLAGMRRRGYTPEAIRAFAERVGVAKANSTVDVQLLEHTIRDDLNFKAPRVMAVLRPLKVVLTNYPADRVESLDAPYWPHDVPKTGSRQVPFARTLYIERDDFQEVPQRKFFRLAPGREVRLRYAYVIKCEEVVKDPVTGEIVELRCRYDPQSRGGDPADGRKVKATLHWVAADASLPATVRVYDRLFRDPKPDTGDDFRLHLNPESLTSLTSARVERSLANTTAGSHYQFERHGYFFADPIDCTADNLVFNRTVALKDTWAKLEVKPSPEAGRAQSAGTSKTPSSPTPSPAPAPPSEADLGPQGRRLVDEFGISVGAAAVLEQRPDVEAFYRDALRSCGHGRAQAVANWVVNEVLREIKDQPLEHLRFDGPSLGRLVELVENDTISTNAGRQVFAELVEHGGDPVAIVERLGLEPLRDEAQLAALIDQLVADNPKQVAKFRDGNARMLGFFVGQVMRATSGQADAKLVDAMVRRALA